MEEQKERARNSREVIFEKGQDDFIETFYDKDSLKDRDNGGGRYISWSEGDKQPVDEWLYQLHFGTGAYIFGEDYEGQQRLFQDFFEELRTYKPDYEDLHNHCLYWKIENAKEIMENYMVILNKYCERNRNELKSRKIEKLEKELQKLKNN